MRFQNWDVLLFPDPSKIPLQEFKTSCQVIQDPESQSLQPNLQLLPTVTSFIPGLPAGSPFRVSIHCWQNPEISRAVRDLRKTADNVLFEARVFVDGRVVASKWFAQSGPWPTVVDLSIDLDKNGEFERIRFPAFHQELLSQSYWNPADDLGRIKVVISEGFAREGLTYPFERVKNIVSFSFQHAPLHVLESSAIAWPNESMWRQVSLVGPYLAQHCSPRREPNRIEDHTHSPRQQPSARTPFPAISAQFPPPGYASMPPPNLPAAQRQQATFDPFTESGHPAFTHWRQRSSADVSMQDYTSRGSSSRQASDPMQGTESTNPVLIMDQGPTSYDHLVEAMQPKAPVNTPRTGAATPVTAPSTANAGLSRIPSAKTDRHISESVDRSLRTAISLGNSNLAKTFSDVEERAMTPVIKSTGGATVKSRKENMAEKASRVNSNAGGSEMALRVVSQSFVATNPSGSKRSRVVTPAAAKVIDDEDEPRSVSSLRNVSRGSARPDGKDAERRTLGQIENM